jgi:GntR family transcriptional regulator, rspAB operon transcriptional repressor
MSGLRREEIYEQIRQDILSCKLAPGASLFEGALADIFEVSKSPIRDALSRLHAEKLVTVEPRKGYRVASVSLHDARELFEFRALLEQHCALSAAAEADDAALAALDHFRDLSAWGEDGFVAYNRAFHFAVLDLAPNRRIVETAIDLIEQFDRLVQLSVTVFDNRNFQTLLSEHQAIIDALQARDGRRAGKLLNQHVARAEKRVMKALSSVSILP